MNSIIDDSYQFVDTNILVYAHDLSAGDKHIRARDLIQGFWESRYGCLSVQVLQEFYVNVTQKVMCPINWGEAARIISDLACWRVHEPKSKDVLEAIDLQQRYRISFWDAMILQSATQLNCTVIWSEDLNPGQVYEDISVVNPFL